MSLAALLTGEHELIMAARCTLDTLADVPDRRQ